MERTQFTMLGDTGSGKTCYLLAMYLKMLEGVGKFTIAIPKGDFEKEQQLARRAEMLDEEDLGRDRFPEGTNSTQKYTFNLKIAHEDVLQFDWYDYPGSVLKPSQADPAMRENLKKNLFDSSVLFICIDGAKLAGGSVDQKIRKVKKISRYVNQFLSEYRDEKQYIPPIAIIVTKYDLYAQETNENELRTIFEESFTSIFSRDDTFIAIIPVSIGLEIEFDDNRGELDPINIELPIFYGIQIAIYYKQHEFENMNRNLKIEIDNNRFMRDFEKDRFFLWRDDTMINLLNHNISNYQSEIDQREQFIKTMNQYLPEIESHTDKINLQFWDGRWH